MSHAWKPSCIKGYTVFLYKYTVRILSHPCDKSLQRLLYQGFTGVTNMWQIDLTILLFCINIQYTCFMHNFVILHIYCVIFLSHRDAQMWQMTFLYMFLQIYYRQICHLSHYFVTWDKNVTKLKSWNPYSLKGLDDLSHILSHFLLNRNQNKKE